MQKYLKHSTALIPFIMLLLLFILIRPGYINGPDFLLAPGLQLILYAMFLVYWMGFCPLRKSCQAGDIFEVLYNLVPVTIAGLLLFAQYHIFLSILIIILMIVVYILGIRFWKQEPDYEEKKEAYGKINNRLTVVAILLLTLIPTGCSVFVYGLTPYHVAAEKDMIQEFTPKDVRKTPDATFLAEFSEENWKTHPTEEKVALLQSLVNYECAKLGVEREIEVKTEVTGLSQLGAFNHKNNQIQINMSNLEKFPAEKIVITILHETFHAFQNDLIDRIDWGDPVTNSTYFDKARIWKQNQEEYVKADPFENPESVKGYENQPLETSARAYADQEYKALKGYIDGEKSDLDKTSAEKE